MKKEELMIGDWVYNTHNRQNEQVAEIGSGLVMLDYNDLYEYDEIEPIPLTTEILERNFHEPNEGVVWWKNDEPFYHVECLPLNGMRLIMPYTQYVHELQHALRLAQIDKEVKI